MNREQHYLRDVFAMLLDRGREAKVAAAVERSENPNGAFEAGRSQGYYEVLSTMLHQLDGFGIERASVELPERLDLESELL
jgi:hypothetical protein